jgi:glycosyltransferase involved in cell wall biosynthesis
MFQKSSLLTANGKGVAYVSTYPPRECGIATFTKDLVNAVDGLHEFKSPVVIAINEKETIYNYDQGVKCQIERDSIEDYVQAAHYVNSSKADLVNLQHEFGLFGGDWGEYINVFMENLQKPVVTTLHTISPDFGLKAQSVLKQIMHHSEAIVVITKTALQLLENYDIGREKIKVIPHGCPDVPFVPSEKVKPSLGLDGRIVLSTFGLINRGKGVEYAINALPSIVEKEPRVLYIVIGETHPEVRKTEGERYRMKLMRLVDELQLGKHVRFHNRFLSKLELIRYLRATDIYISPYIASNQVSSGTLVYALGMGKAIISTPYLHAKEALANGRGLFCKFKDPNSVAKSIDTLLRNEGLRRRMEKKAYEYSRKFVWSNVAIRYAKLFKQVLKT